MYVSNLVVVFVLASASILNAVFVQAQQTEDVSEHDDFRITTSVSIGLTGPSYSTQFQLIDELGVEFDLMSLVADPAVRESIQLSTEQLTQIQAMKQAVQQELQTQIAGAITSKDGKQEIETRFREVVEGARSVLSPDQLVLLEQARIQRGIKRHGLPEFFATRQMRDQFGLSDDDLEKLKSNHVDATASHHRRMESLVQEANRALMAELTDANQAKLRGLLGEDGFNQFVASNMFVGKKTLYRAKQAHSRNLLRQLRIKKVRDQLKLTADQYEQVQSLLKRAREHDNEALRNEMDQVLSSEQTHQLNQYGVLSETSRFGTVNALGRGLLGNLLDLTPEESAGVLEAGKQIFADLTQDLANSKFESLRGSLESISAQQRERIIAVLDDSTMLK